MDELIHATIHDALDVQEPAGLRARVIRAVPMDRPRRRHWRLPTVSGQWAAGFAAILLTTALIAGLVYSRIGPLPGGKHNVGPAIRLTSPTGLAVGADGTVYVADYLSNRVFRMRSDGSLVTVAGGGLLYEGPATKTNLFGPQSLAVSPDGNLFIAENPGTRISRVDRNGNLSTYFSWHSAGFVNEPSGVAVSPAGVLYVTLSGGITAIQPDGTTSRIELTGLPGPAVWPGQAAVDSYGNLYVSDMAPVAILTPQVPPPPGGCRILRVAPDNSLSVIAGTGSCGYSGDGGPATSAQLNDPKGLAFDSAGNLYFADSHNHRVRRIDTHGIITTVAGTGTEGDNGDGGPAIWAELAYLGGVALQGQFLYVTEEETASGAYGAVRLINLRDGTIRTVVSTRSRVVS